MLAGFKFDDYPQIRQIKNLAKVPRYTVRNLWNDRPLLYFPTHVFGCNNAPPPTSESATAAVVFPSAAAGQNHNKICARIDIYALYI